VARIYRTSILAHHGDGTQCVTTLHYQTDLAPLGDEPDPNDVASGVWTLLGTAYKNVCRTDVTIDTVVCAEETLPPAIGVSGAHTVNTAGLWAPGTANSPHGLVPVLNLHTGTRSRSARGWTHLPGNLSNTTYLIDTWTATVKGYYDALAALLDDTFTLGTVPATTVRPVVYSRTRHKRAETPYTFNVTSGTTNPKVKWLRSRMSNP
jgi:hypothetical protein